MIGMLITETNGSPVPQSKRKRMSGTELTYCIRDLEVETRLRCNKCDSFICYRCLVQTAVGFRCPDCADVRRLPTVPVDLTSYLKSLAFGVVASMGLGALWGLLFRHLVGIPFLPLLTIILIGYIIGEGISVVVNRRRERYLQYIAALFMGMSYVVAGLVNGLVFATTFPDLFFLSCLGIGMLVAADRVK